MTCSAKEIAKMTEQSNCCSTTEDGSAICLIPENGEKPDCACESNRIQELPIVKEAATEKLRSSLAFLLACVTSPCCTPLILPIVMGLAAGSPFALWLGAHLGWVYAGLTLISVLSFVLGLRWINRPKPSKHIIRLSTISVKQGEKAHG
jgi:hypothetical protein